MHNKIICQQIFHKDSDKLIDTFKEVGSQVLNKQLQIEQIKSTSVFPDIVTIKDKNILYWDIQYFEFFDRFLTELVALLENRAYQLQFIEQVSGIFYDFLSLKLIHIPELAYCIQVNRQRRFPAKKSEITVSKANYHRYLDGTYRSIIVQTRHLVFNHELFHLYYKDNPNTKLDDMSRLKKLANYYMEHDLTARKVEGTPISFVEEGFQKLIDSKYTKLFEEASCDYRALIETIALYRGISEIDTVELIKQIHDAFHINQAFLSYLTNIFVCWQTLYKSYLAVDSYDELLPYCKQTLDTAVETAVIRNSIIPDFLDSLNILKYEINSYNSVLNDVFIKETIHHVADNMVDLNFMLYAIEESIKLSNQPNFNPFELKNIILGNISYLQQ